MIHRLSANKESFHPVEFTTGLNIILAERTNVSTQKDTRNGLGKSTLIQILDFCLGAQATTGKGLCIPPLEDWIFTLDITLAGNRITATRSIKSPGQIEVVGPTANFVEKPRFDAETKKQIYTLEEWRTLLGWAFFKLSNNGSIKKYNPSYRSLIPYFLRQGIDSYVSPFRHFRQQKPWNIQVAIAYLLGLNWEYARNWQEIKDQEAGVKAIEKAVKSGTYAESFGSIGEMETERVQLESSSENSRQALKNFRVHPQYEEIQAEADRITSSIHDLINQNVINQRRLKRYQESIADEKTVETVSIEQLYKEVGVVFSDPLKHTLAEVKQFHSQVIKNRKVFIEVEVGKVQETIAEINKKLKELTVLRAKSLEILSTHGALQEMTTLQDKQLQVNERLERLRLRISEIRGIVSHKRELKVAKSELAKVAERDYDQRRDLWATPIRIFNANSQALYNMPGNLIIEISDAGYKFDVEIERSGSEGIEKMKVFCFDLMLLQLPASYTSAINFLAHDSGLYDGVDSRQRAHALELAAVVSQQTGKQYICALNSDNVPYSDFSKDFDFKSFIRLTLTDRDTTGSLLGFRFDKPAKVKRQEK